MYKFSVLLNILLFLFSSKIKCQNQNDSLSFSTLEYRHIGPTRGGRATSVAGITSKPGTFFMGATGGGVWKTDDYGLSWENVSDGVFRTPSVGDIQVSQSNPEVVYVGTGSDGIRSNIISGKGVYKSVDEGLTWHHIGLQDAGQIGAVEIHPNNADVVFVAAIGQAFNPNPERGIFRSMDGGANWEHVYFHSDSVGVVDIEFHPTNPSIIYAGLWRVERKPWTIVSGGYKAGGILKSTDGGTNWKKVANGLPKGLIGKIDLAVSKADPDRIYALIEAPENSKEGGLYRSNDQGENFELVTTKKELLDRPFYYCNIEADPNNADVIYSLATSFYKSVDAGENWKRINVPHGDNHDMWINPNNSDLFIQCNDGGANVTHNGGKTWSSQNNQPTAEIYQVAVDDQFPYWVYGGQQDNSTIAVPSNLPYNATGGTTSFWMAVGGCETGPAVPKPGNHNIVYSNCKGRFGTFNKLTGQELQYYVGASNMYGHNPKDLKYRFQRVAPIHVSPHNPNVIYHCSQFVHKTTDEGKTWETISPDLTAFEEDKQVISGSPITRDVTGEEFYSTIYSIRESSTEKGLIWVGANDGPIHVTKNGGKSWKNVTPKMPNGGRVDAVEPSPHKAGKAYVNILRYQLGDWQPYIFKTENYGQSWTKITNGIPEDFPVRVVREDPDKEGLLYAGTEYGMFLSTDDGKNWKSFQLNLPITPITDIKIHRKELVLSTMGRGFWILNNLSLLHQYDEINSEISLLKIENTYRQRRVRGGGDGVTYSSPGANIFYYLPDTLAGELQLKILDKNDVVIRTFTSLIKKSDDDKKDEPDMATGFSSRATSSLLKKSVGLHNFKWDMRHEGSWDKEATSNGRNGPFVVPGDYKVQLIANDKVIEESFSVLIDPRLEQAGVYLEDLIAQEELALEIRDFQSEAKKTAEKIKEKIEEIEKLSERKRKKRKEDFEKLSELKDQFITKDGRYQQPMLLSQISYLSSMVNRADQLPGRDAYNRFDELKTQFEELRLKAEGILN